MKFRFNNFQKIIIFLLIIFAGVFLWTESSRAVYVMPVGIPTPEFGIVENHTMYAGQGGYADAGNGPYTHYIDNLHPQATDNNNPSGSPARPRLSIPRDLPAGAVVEIHNGTNTNGWGEVNITGQGTASQPIFIRGIGNPRVNNMIDVGYYGNASYIIIEGINAFSIGFLGRQNGTSFTNHHLILRNSEINGDLNDGGVGISSWTQNTVNNIVIYNNNIHDNGDVGAAYDQDVHGIAVGSGASYVWVLDNELARNSGDGIQINGYGMANPALLNHIYVGRNTSHHNKQTGFWTKTAADVIFSQNTSYAHRPSGSSGGAGMGFQYAPSRVWFLFNHVYDNTCGICSGSDSTTFGQDSYIIGNVIHNIKPGFNPTGGGWGSAAIMLAGGINRYVIANTIYDADAGINTPSNRALYVYNNIISNITNSQGSHIYIEKVGTWEAKNNLFFQNGSSARIKLGNTTYSVPELQSSYATLAQANLTADPLFVNSTGNDFHIQSNSSAKDTAMISSAYSTFQSLYGLSIAKDYGEISRPQGPAWDIGAYEYVSGGVPVDTTPPAAPTGLAVM